jgi:hypothetical protein
LNTSVENLRSERELIVITKPEASKQETKEVEPETQEK